MLCLLGRYGLHPTFVQTGGMCAAIEMRLETGELLLVTDADDSLAWDRCEHRGWLVALYPADGDVEPDELAFERTDDGDPAALANAVDRLLRISTGHTA